MKYSAETGVAYAIPMYYLVARIPFWCAHFFVVKKEREEERNMKKSLKWLALALVALQVMLLLAAP